MFNSSQSRAVLGETDGPPKVKKLLSRGKRQGGLFTSSSRKAGMCGGKINKTRYKHIPQMNRIIGAEQGCRRHLSASRQTVGACHVHIKVPPEVENNFIRGSNENQHIIEETNHQEPSLRAGHEGRRRLG